MADVQALPCTWLTTYQKSGTTWVRFLIHDVLAGPVRSSSDLDALIPIIHGNDTRWQAALAQGGVLSTHKAYGPHAERYGDVMQGFVHVVRHPADVLLSEARFFCLTQADGVARAEGRVSTERLQKLMRDYLNVMLAHGKSVRHDRMGMGSWAEHARGWLERRDRGPSLLIRYEDLKAQPKVEVHRLATFFGRHLTDAQAAAVVQRCSLDAMRQMQDQELAAQNVGCFYHGPEFETAYSLGLRFVGRGVVGDGTLLGDEALQRIESMFGPVMTQLGYTVQPGHTVVDVPELRALAPLPADWRHPALVASA